MNNLKIIFSIFILTFSISSLFGQALPIGLDGKFDDWTSEAASYTDSQGDGTSFDLLSFKVSNDSNFLFIQIALDQEIQLNYGNNLYLEIDGDNNAATGYSVNGIGAELEIEFGWKNFYYYGNSGQETISPYDIGFIALPTVTSDTFEMCIDRHALPDSVHSLFTNDTIKICFKSDDYMPNYGTTFSYTFDNTPVEAYIPISFEKNNDSDIRIMTYNTLYDGLIDNARVSAFENIVTVVNPDIITFNECWNTTQYQAKNLLDSWLPLNETQWSCIKNDEGNITCSKFPITDFFDIDPTYINRVTANVIDLPESYPRDILVINAHFKASGGSSNDALRQEQADAVINFIRDVKTSGGTLTLPYGTPFVISGDLNLVGNSQQQTTLLTGEIPGEGVFPPDWDNSDFNDIISFHTDIRTASTRIEDGDYWPGRLDYAIASDIGATVNKAFTICTHEMSTERLNQYNLNSDDTDIASDHLPKITDFIIEDIPGEVSNIEKDEFRIFPNPAVNKQFSVSCKNAEIQKIEIFNLTGKLIFTKQANTNREKINLSGYPSGIYFVRVKTGNSEKNSKIILE